MSRRSIFESQLNFRQYGFAIKIPDAGVGLKPFDYVVAIPARGVLRFVAIEAKKATGWTLNKGAWQPHQRRALSLVESLAPYSSWVAIGFLDAPRMKRDYDGTSVKAPLKKRAFLLWWPDYLSIEGETSCHYADIISKFSDDEMLWDKVGKRYCWTILRSHKMLNCKPNNC